MRGSQPSPVTFEAGPFKLNWWETDDLGDVIDKLATDTPFEYVEEHRWANDGESIDTLENVIEPHLMTIGFIEKTSKGRVLTDAGSAHIS